MALRTGVTRVTGDARLGVEPRLDPMYGAPSRRVGRPRECPAILVTGDALPRVVALMAPRLDHAHLDAVQIRPPGSVGIGLVARPVANLTAGRRVGLTRRLGLVAVVAAGRWSRREEVGGGNDGRLAVRTAADLMAGYAPDILIDEHLVV